MCRQQHGTVKGTVPLTTCEKIESQFLRLARACAVHLQLRARGETVFAAGGHGHVHRHVQRGIADFPGLHVEKGVAASLLGQLHTHLDIAPRLHE